MPGALPFGAVRLIILRLLFRRSSYVALVTLRLTLDGRARDRCWTPSATAENRRGADLSCGSVPTMRRSSASRGRGTNLEAALERCPGDGLSTIVGSGAQPKRRSDLGSEAREAFRADQLSDSRPELAKRHRAAGRQAGLREASTRPRRQDRAAFRGGGVLDECTPPNSLT